MTDADSGDYWDIVDLLTDIEKRDVPILYILGEADYVPENVELPPVEGDLSDEATPFEDEVNDDEIYREPVENSDIGDLGIENTLGLDPQPEPSNEEDQDAPDPTDTDNGDGTDKMSLLEALANNIYSAPSANGFGYGDDEDKN